MIYIYFSLLLINKQIKENIKWFWGWWCWNCGDNHRQTVNLKKYKWYDQCACLSHMKLPAFGYKLMVYFYWNDVKKNLLGMFDAFQGEIVSLASVERSPKFLDLYHLPLMSLCTQSFCSARALSLTSSTPPPPSRSSPQPFIFSFLDVHSVLLFPAKVFMLSFSLLSCVYIFYLNTHSIISFQQSVAVHRIWHNPYVHIERNGFGVPWLAHDIELFFVAAIKEENIFSRSQEMIKFPRHCTFLSTSSSVSSSSS